MRWSGVSHLRASRRSLAAYTSSGPSDVQRLVILGTGWASYSLLKNVDKRGYEVVVVSPRNHFLFTPLLASTTVGTLEFRSIIEPIRNAGFRDDHHFHLSKATGVDTSTQQVTCQSELDPSVVYSLDYDRLVIGVGAVSSTFGVPGVAEHGFFLKEISDARRIRDRLLVNFELATQPSITPAERERLLHVVIVGGGPTGVEFAAEFYDFLKQDVSRLYTSERDVVRVSLVEAQQILSSFDAGLQKYAERKLRQRPQMRILSDSVVEVTPTCVHLRSGQRLSCGITVWSAGLAPRPFTESLDFTKTPQGQIVVDQWLRVASVPKKNVYAIGDCAAVLDNAMPCTAQVAERQGRYLGKALAADQPAPFRFQSQGMLAYIGEYKGLSDLPVGKMKGFMSWLLWRSAYTTRLGSWRLRMQVPIDWFKTFFFGRDTSRF